MRIRININGENFYADWIKQGDSNIFHYKKFIVRSKDPTKCMPFLIGYIKLHQEFIKPDGALKLKKTIETIIEGIYTKSK